jgi:DNA-binding transcriptional MerR regulator
VDSWTLQELVAEAERRTAALPPPRNGQVRAVPDERTIRYYAAIGLLDRPAAMRGRTALYSARHLAQVVAIKRLQVAGRSLAEIQTMWAGIEDEALERLSGVAMGAKRKGTREGFWKKSPQSPVPSPQENRPGLGDRRLETGAAPVQLSIELAPGITLVLDAPLAIPTAADLAALRAVTLSELARRGLAARAPGTLEEKKP